ncbi:uncharacterized protein LOC135377555 isoform X2 [Ornithodoros turicata]|uniref:uncharacterized protein LOC135377555 isoform X2 n=1 Tax=Ornithodoros turicata TaxID=34597 RepID=UPI00313982DC
MLDVYARNPRDSNFYLDRVLLTDMITQVRFMDMDPYKLPSFETRFQDKVLGVPLKGTAKFGNGTMKGLSRVNRFGDCTAPGWLHGNITVTCNLLINDLDIEYDARVRYGFIPEMRVKVESKVGACYAHIEATAAPGKTAVLRSFQITSLGELSTKWSGLGPLNPYLRVINDGYKANIAGAVYSTFYNSYRAALDRSLSMEPIPKP